MLRKERVREMLTAQRSAASVKDALWATLVFTQRQACCFVLNELVLRLPTFSTFLAHWCDSLVRRANLP